MPRGDRVDWHTGSHTNNSLMQPRSQAGLFATITRKYVTRFGATGADLGEGSAVAEASQTSVAGSVRGLGGIGGLRSAAAAGTGRRVGIQRIS